jgi:transposase InsO family protein
MGVSTSGFYAFLSRKPSKRGLSDARLKPVLLDMFEQNRKCYGKRRMQRILRELNYFCGLQRIGRLMKELGLKPKAAKVFKKTTLSDHCQSVAENKLDRQFRPEKPNQCWVADITYLRTRNGWAYLAVVIDLFSRKVIGRAMADHMYAKLVCQALEMAHINRPNATGYLFHSDRGVQYASYEFQLLLKKYGLIGSMSRKGNCWDNAPCESFFHTMKNETVGKRIFNNLEEMKSCLFDYIEIFYNRKRLHSTIGYTSPESYENMRQAS